MADLVPAEVAAAWARALGHPVQVATIRQWAKRGHITTHRHGRQHLYDIEDVQAYLATRPDPQTLPDGRTVTYSPLE